MGPVPIGPWPVPVLGHDIVAQLVVHLTAQLRRDLLVFPRSPSHLPLLLSAHHPHTPGAALCRQEPTAVLVKHIPFDLAHRLALPEIDNETVKAEASVNDPHIICEGELKPLPQDAKAQVNLTESTLETDAQPGMEEIVVVLWGGMMYVIIGRYEERSDSVRRFSDEVEPAVK